MGNGRFPFDARVSFAACFMAKDVCRARSLQGVAKALVCTARTMSLNYADDSVRSLLYLDNAYAIDEYKWESRWNTQLAPSVRGPSFPVSFWASDTLKQHQLGCQVELSSSRISWRCWECHRPLAQPRDSMMRNECAAFRWTKSTVEGNEKGFCREHQNGFYELLTKPKLKAI